MQAASILPAPGPAPTNRLPAPAASPAPVLLFEKEKARPRQKAAPVEAAMTAVPTARKVPTLPFVVRHDRQTLRESEIW